MTSKSESTSEYAGGYSEKGFLNNLLREGFNENKCVCELYANSIDANATEVKWCYTKIYTYLIDNGIGMNKENLSKMFIVNNENHKSEKTLGVNGYGSKPALLKLSNKTSVKILTKSTDNTYLRALIPWDKMFEEGKWSNMIEINEQNADEKNITNLYLGDNKTGTIIQFNTNENLLNTIENIFSDFKTDNKKILNDHPSFVFGKFDVDFQYENKTAYTNVKSMLKYNYFGKNDSDYFDSKFETTIELYVNYNNNKYDYTNFKWNLIIDENKYEIKKSGKGLSKDATKCLDNLEKMNYKHCGTMHISIACEKDNEIFNISNPPTQEEFNDKSFNGKISNYDNNFFNANTKQYKKELKKYQFYRNNQMINFISNPEDNNSERGNTKEWFKKMLLKIKIEYFPVSDQDNIIDNILGIRKNKNDYNNFDKQLNRLIEHARNHKYRELLKYFEKNYKQQEEEKQEQEQEEKEEKQEQEQEEEEEIDNKL